MIEQKMKVAGLPERLSPLRYGVTAITDVLNQDLAHEDVQRFAGDSDTRTTRIYERRRKVVMWNKAQQISIRAYLNDIFILHAKYSELLFS